MMPELKKIDVEETGPIEPPKLDVKQLKRNHP